MDDLLQNDKPSVDFMILADYVEALHGKLYMMGGAWENIGVSDFSQPLTLSLAVGVQIPWNATNRQHMLSIDVQSADADQLAEVDSTIMVGRPPFLEEGASQRQSMALKIPLELPGPGTYVIVASVNGIETRRLIFRAMATQQATMFPPE
jgi:hypothetical protein